MSLRERLAARLGNRAANEMVVTKPPEPVSTESPAVSPKPKFIPPREILEEIARLQAEVEREEQAQEAERLRREEAEQEAERSRRRDQELRRQWDREMARREAELPPKEPGYEPPADW